MFSLIKNLIVNITGQPAFCLLVIAIAALGLYGEGELADSALHYLYMFACIALGAGLFHRTKD